VDRAYKLGTLPFVLRHKDLIEERDTAVSYQQSAISHQHTLLKADG
jgi:hypothetical protein